MRIRRGELILSGQEAVDRGAHPGAVPHLVLGLEAQPAQGFVRASRHLRPRGKSRSRLVASLEAAARRVARLSERASCDFAEAGAAQSLIAYARGLRDLADQVGARGQLRRPTRRRSTARSPSQIEL